MQATISKHLPHPGPKRCARFVSSERLVPALTFSYASAIQFVATKWFESLALAGGHCWPASAGPSEAWRGRVDSGVSVPTGASLWATLRGGAARMAWAPFVESPGQMSWESSSCASADGPLCAWRVAKTTCGWGSFCPFILGLLGKEKTG